MSPGRHQLGFELPVPLRIAHEDVDGPREVRVARSPGDRAVPHQSDGGAERGTGRTSLGQEDRVLVDDGRIDRDGIPRAAVVHAQHERVPAALEARVERAASGIVSEQAGEPQNGAAALVLEAEGATFRADGKLEGGPHAQSQLEATVPGGALFEIEAVLGAARRG